MLAHAFSMRRVTSSRDKSAENRRYNSTAVRFPNRNDQKPLTQRLSNDIPRARPRARARVGNNPQCFRGCRSRRVLAAVAFGHAPSPAPFPHPRARCARPRSHADTCSNNASGSVPTISQHRGKHSGARSGKSGLGPPHPSPCALVAPSLRSGRAVSAGSLRSPASAFLSAIAVLFPRRRPRVSLHPCNYCGSWWLHPKPASGAVAPSRFGVPRSPQSPNVRSGRSLC